MRRALAAALLGISLWIGSLAWTGFLMTRTVLDPGRSEAVADALLDDPEVRAQLEANIAGGVAAALPAGAPIDRAAIDAGAATALDSPAVEAIFRDAFVRTHQAFLGEGEPPRSVDGVLPESPSLAVPLPTERVPDLGPVREVIAGAVPALAAVAAAGTMLALVVSRDRPRVVRRAGFWAIGLSAFALVVAFGVPALAHAVAPDQAAVVAALVSALAESARTPALVLFGAGVVAVVASLLWRAAPALAPARQPEPVAPAPRRTRGSPPRVPVPRRPAPVVMDDRTMVRAPAPVDATRIGHGPVDATRVDLAPTALDRRPGARRVEGVGWVHEGADPIPPGARWVVGVGYVLPD